MVLRRYFFFRAFVSGASYIASRSSVLVQSARKRNGWKKKEREKTETEDGGCSDKSSQRVKNRGHSYPPCGTPITHRPQKPREREEALVTTFIV